jgi:hypothetical protein
MLSFQFVRSARILLAGIDTMHMIKKGQLDCPNGQVASAADQFYFRAGCSLCRYSSSLTITSLSQQHHPKPSYKGSARVPKFRSLASIYSFLFSPKVH